MSAGECVKEAVSRTEECMGTLSSKIVPSSTNYDHPEMDELPLLSDNGVRNCQMLIGMAQQLVITGRLEMTCTVSSLSQFSCAPKEGHVKAVLQVWGHLKKSRGKCIMIDPRPPIVDKSVVDHEADFSDQCPDADEELDDKFPKGLVKELQTTALVDADHGHDKKM